MSTPSQPDPSSILLELSEATFRAGGSDVFPRSQWRIRASERWAVLGANGSGKSLFAACLAGRLPVFSGEVHYGFEDPPETAVALLSNDDQRQLLANVSEFHQARWHSGIEADHKSVADLLAEQSVLGINPFEVTAAKRDSAAFLRHQRQVLRDLKITGLMSRHLVRLSNGEMRKVLLARALLRSPRLLLLDDPFSGLDAEARARFLEFLNTQVRRMPILVFTSRLDEVPDQTTHVLVLGNCSIAAQGPISTLRRQGILDPFCTSAPKLSPARKAVQQRSRSRDTAKPAKSAEPVLAIEDVTILADRKRILQNVHWTIQPGEHWAVAGPNGAGKSTLLSLLQADHPQFYAQRIRLNGIAAGCTASAWEWRQQIGSISPELLLHYPSAWPCLQVVCSGFTGSVGLFQDPSARQLREARAWLRQLGLESRAGESIGALPAGEQRLVLLARALAKRPRLLLLDEPCQGLGPEARRLVLDACELAAAQSGTTLVFVTHYMGELPRCVTHLLRLHRGRATYCGPLPDERRVPAPSGADRACVRAAPR